MKIIKIKPNTQEWLDFRKGGIGGSDIAAMLNISPWKTRYQLWLEKTGKSKPLESNRFMEWGHILEPVIRQKYCDVTQKSIITPSAVIIHDKYDFLRATVDGITNDNRLLEIKTTGYDKDWGEEGSDQVPETYYLQVQHYLLITGLNICDVAVLVKGNDFRLYEITANKDIQDLIVAESKKFWDLVENLIEPEPEDIDDIRAKFLKSTNATIEAREDIVLKINRIKTNKALMKDLEAENLSNTAEIMLYMGDNDTLTRFDEVIAIWKTTKDRKKFDASAFKAKHPSTYNAFCTDIGPTRPFLIKKF